MYSRQKTTALLTVLIMFSFTAYAEKGGIPTEVVWGLGTLFTIIGLAISFFVSYALRSVLEKYRNERRKHIWFMTSFTFLLPVVFGILKEQFHWLAGFNKYEYHVFYILLAGLIIFGFTLGYLQTPKKNK
jgi:O-antigen/teichoic acid export membrane protein